MGRLAKRKNNALCDVYILAACYKQQIFTRATEKHIDLRSLGPALQPYKICEILGVHKNKI